MASPTRSLTVAALNGAFFGTAPHAAPTPIPGPQPLISEQSSMRRWRTQAHEKDPPRVFVSVAVGIGIGIAFGIKVAVDEHLDTDSDSDPDSDPRISRHPLYFRSRA